MSKRTALEAILLLTLIITFIIHILSIFGIYFDTLYAKVLFLFIEMIISSLLAVTYAYDKELHHKKRTIIKFHYLIFILYIISLIDVLFLSSDLSRGINYMSNYDHMNMIPFHTINLYINGYQNGTVSLPNTLINLLGNIILFMPFAYFIPFFFLNQRKWYNFLLLSIVVVLCVEMIQYNLAVGSGDIDDLILNVSGAMLFYSISQLTFSKPIYRTLGRE